MAELAVRGWETHVLTAPLDANDATLPRDEALAGLYRDAYARTEIEFREERLPSSHWQRLRRCFQREVVPDDDNWIERTASAALQILRERDAVFVSFAQPWIDHLIGLKLKRLRSSIPWLAHFSDPWVDSPYYDQNDPAQAKRMIRWREQERAVAKHADAIVFVTAETADLVMSKYPESWRSKVHVVPHGFDRSIISTAGLSPHRHAGEKRPFRMLYTGNIYEGRREPTELLQTLAELNREGGLRGRMEITFVGHSPTSTKNSASEMKLDGVVSFRNPVSYIESLRLMEAADALLLLDASAETNVFLPSKIVDYLMIGRPILGLTPGRGASVDVLRRTGHMTVDPRDKPAIQRALLQLLETHERGAPSINVIPEQVDLYDIRRTTDRFEIALEAAMNRTGHL